MKKFMDENFLLTTDTAKSLYHDYAEKQPIIDYHCHINPKEIYEDKRFENITEVWLGGDHYKWRLMRANGIEEKYITGDASPRDKFQKWAETLPKAIGNPLYHWSHLELKRYFGYQGILNGNTAEEVWNMTNDQLNKPSMSARNIIKASNVTVICTTDSPTDSLEWHKKIASDETFTVKVLPAFRPDKAINIEKPDFVQHVMQLSELSGIAINSFTSFCDALSNRVDYFVSVGCRISDHALPYVMYVPASGAEIEAIYQSRIDGSIPNENEQLAYKTALMLFLGREYHKRDWAMQLHYGTLRENNTLMHKKLGPDTGFDCIDNNSSSAQLSAFLNALCLTNQLPKTIVYSLNPADNSYIDTVIGCFQDSSAVGKLQHGSAWWFNDHKTGMLEQLTSLANSGLLANFIGMLTDSRSFLSYTRHEYFRRILCNLIGNLVEEGEYPDDMENLGRIVKDISYNNAINYIIAK
ncbi:MAG TPA: glucuronate isomerase [Mobilitalea sp.]|nr:glucuronate isomerase [Mobilitalea sp.]